MKYIVECDIRTGIVNSGPSVWVQVMPVDGRVGEFDLWYGANRFMNECDSVESSLNYRVTEI